MNLHLYAALQYASGLFGMLLLALSVVTWARREPRRPVAMPSARHRVVAVSAILASALVVASGNVARTVEAGAADRRVVVIAAALGGMTGCAISAFAYAATIGRRISST